MTTAKKAYPRSTRRREALHLVARQYSSANLKKPKEYWDDTLPSVKWGSLGEFEVVRQVGKGKYGEVYESYSTSTQHKCVIKIMRPVKEHRLRREIKILQHVKGHANIVELLEVLRDADTKTPCFVFEHVDAISFRELQAKVTDMEVRHYMYQLLQALDHCHSRGIMHRDVKPGNVLIDHATKQLKLIDWGLADFYHPGKEYPVRVATRFYKGPELLVDIKDYDYSLDVWGVGCIMASLIFKRPVFFRGEDEFDQLVKIARVLGSDGLHKYCDKYGVQMDSRLEQLVGIRPAVPWRKFRNADNEHLCSAEAFDLLGKVLMYDHHERLTCTEAMAHPYFAPIREAAAQAATGAVTSMRAPAVVAAGAGSSSAATTLAAVGVASGSSSAAMLVDAHVPLVAANSQCDMQLVVEAGAGMGGGSCSTSTTTEGSAVMPQASSSTAVLVQQQAAAAAGAAAQGKASSLPVALALA